MEDTHLPSRRRPGTWALGIALGYVTLASLWILFSDRFTTWLTEDLDALALIQTGKGFAFVGVTGLLLFLFTRWMGVHLLKANRLAEWARHDSLTGLASRTQLIATLDRFLTERRHGGEKLAVIAMDVSRLRRINASFGVRATDGLLLQLAHALRETRDPRVVLGRTGSDHFVALVRSPCDTHDARVIAQMLLHAGAGPFQVAGRPIRLRLDAGIAMAPADGDDPQTLLHRAQTAVFEAKQAEKSAISFAGTIGRQGERESVSLESDLDTALGKGQFRLMYQPMFSLESGEIIGCEALLRWSHPEFGLVSPDRFIPLLEQTGDIVPVGAWVVDEAVGQLRQWKAAHGKALTMGINLSRRQLWDDGLEAMLRDTVERHGIDPGHLCLEITETLAMQDPALTSGVLASLREAGFTLAMDDFGSGYSCLAYLKHYPLDVLKIDRAFVSGVPGDSDNLALLRIILDMARTFGVGTVAEGIETESEARTLVELGCDKAQGYWMARPLTADDMNALLDQNEHKSALSAITMMAENRQHRQRRSTAG